MKMSASGLDSCVALDMHSAQHTPVPKQQQQQQGNVLKFAQELI